MLLRTEELTKSFDGFKAVSEVSLKIEKGELSSIIGPNGAGKTTLFNILTGRTKPDKGRVFFKEKEISKLSPYQICRLGIGRSFQKTNIFHHLSVYENVQVALMSWKRKISNIFLRAEKMLSKETQDLLKDVGLWDKREMMAGLLSHGDQRRLEMAIALGSHPELLLLDEPTAGMGPEESIKTVELIQRVVRERGLALLFIEHDINIVFRVSEKIRVMHMGQIISEGNPNEVRHNEEVQRIYLTEEI